MIHTIPASPTDPSIISILSIKTIKLKPLSLKQSFSYDGKNSSFLERIHCGSQSSQSKSLKRLILPSINITLERPYSEDNVLSQNLHESPINSINCIKSQTENINKHIRDSQKPMIKIRDVKLRENGKKTSLTEKIQNFELNEKNTKSEKNQKPAKIQKTAENLTEVKGSMIKWRQGDLIGTGSCGQVYRAMNCMSGQIFAVKKVRTQMNDQMSQRSLEREMSILRQIDHPNIIKCYGYEKLDENMHFYMEYVPGGSISSIINQFGALSEPIVRNYARQLLLGLSYLHRNNILHKDLKAENLLISNDGTLKMTDFGCSKFLESSLIEDSNYSIRGSIPWMAPEVICQTKYGPKADIWSFGCTVLEMITGKRPWQGYNFDNPVEAIMRIGLQNVKPEIPKEIGSLLKKFIERCLERDVHKRPSAEELLSEEFLSE